MARPSQFAQPCGPLLGQLGLVHSASNLTIGELEDTDKYVPAKNVTAILTNRPHPEQEKS